MSDATILSMRTLLCALLLLPVFAAAQTSYDHYNDAYFTGDGSLPDLAEANGVGSKTSIGLPPGTPPEDEEEPPEEEEQPGAKESILPPTAPPPSAPPVPPYSPEGVEDEEDILELLLEGGAISGVESLPNMHDGPVDFESFSSGGFRIVVDGAKVRGLFGSSVSVRDILSLWKSSSERQERGKRLSTGQYYALIAATLSEDDARLERAEFTHVYLEVTYRSRGALFWLIPWSFPVRVTIEMDALADERVTVRFPWYHWFLREYFTRASLAEEIREVIAAEEAKGDDGETLQIRLFVTLTSFLKQKVRTISDSVILGS